MLVVRPLLRLPVHPLPQSPEATGTTLPGDDTLNNTSTSIPNGTLAPGVTNQGIQNRSKLLDAHTHALRERGFELVIERRFSGDSEVRDATYHLTATSDLRRFSQNAPSTVAGNQTTHQSWLNATMERMLVQTSSAGETQYRIPPVGPAGSEARTMQLQRSIQTNQLAELLRGGEFTVTGVNETEETRRYTIVGTNFSTEGYYGEREVRSTVDEDGVIHTLNAAGQSRGGSFNFSYHVTRLSVDSVERPEWVKSAPAPIDTRPTVGFQNCTTPYLTIDNPGPDAIPAGTVVTVQLDGTDYHASLDSPLAPGEQKALYLTPSGTLQVAEIDAVPEDRAGMPNEAEFSVTTQEGMLLSAGGIGFDCETASEGTGSSGSSSTKSGS